MAMKCNKCEALEEYRKTKQLLLKAEEVVKSLGLDPAIKFRHANRIITPTEQEALEKYNLYFEELRKLHENHTINHKKAMFTEIEKEIYYLLLSGMNNKQIS